MTLIEEMIAAGRGVMALIMGRRNASTYFNLTMAGLAGSFVAFLIASGIQTHTAPALLDLIMTEEMQLPSDTALKGWKALLAITVGYAVKMGFAALSLNWMKRLDGFVPFIVASNWADLFAMIGFLALAFMGVSGVVLLVFGGLTLLVHINVARLIVTLRPIQIVFFFVTQVFGSLLAVSIVGGLLLPTPVAAA